jgi:hypothetical protein
MTWSLKGIFDRVLELPDGGVLPAVSPCGRGRIRYNNTTKQLECSLDGGPWTNCFSGGGFTPAYGNLRALGDGTPVPVPGVEATYTGWQVSDVAVNCAPDPVAGEIVITEPGDYIINVTGDFFYDTTLQPYTWEIFRNTTRTRAACTIMPFGEGLNGIAITHLHRLTAGEAIILKVTAPAPGVVVGPEMNMNVHKVGDIPV